MGDRISVFMVCAHEPSLDPRIRWEAEAAARRFDVTVLGFNRPDGSFPATEDRAGYRTIRLPVVEVGGHYYFWRLKDVLPRCMLIPAAVAVALLLPVVGVAEILFRTAAWLLRRLLRLTRRVASKLRITSLLLSLILTPLRRQLSSIRGLLLVRVHYILAVLRVQFSAATSTFWKYIQESTEKPDVIHCNDLDTLLVGVLAKRRYGCRLVFDAHEFYPRSDPAGRWLDITFFSMIERLLIRNADAVVTVNPPLAEAMRAAYGLAEVHSVANAEPWTGRPTKPVGTEMDRLAKGRCKFLFQGRFTPGRGLDELVTAWASVDDARAALFLRGPDNMWREGLRNYAAELNLLDRSIYFLDAVSEDQLVSAAAEADVGIIPYRPLIINDRLSCPNKLSQYLHAGLMVVTNNLPYVKSIVAEAEAGLAYDSDRLETLVDIVDRILADPELLHRCQCNALLFARRRFNWQVEGERLYALYRRSGNGPMPQAGPSFLPAAQ